MMNAHPSGSGERIVSLDVLRGFAILGLLPINIQVFSMIGMAYMNPIIFGDFEGVNKALWMLGHLLFDMKFLTIFSILFGAGVILFTTRLESRAVNPLGMHFRRTLWLMLFGVAHAYLVWGGDILVTYALCGMVVVFLRHHQPRKLLVIGLIVFAVPSALYVAAGLVIPTMDESTMNDLQLMWAPTEEMMQEELASFRSGWLGQMPGRVEHAMILQLFFFIYTGWRAAGLMLLGMALFKWGILSAERSRQFYVRLSILGLLTGIILVAWGMKHMMEADFPMVLSFFFGSQFNYWGSVLVSLGYIGLIMLLLKSGILGFIQNSLQAVGRMALSNYLMQSIICSFIFYGHGFGLIGRVDRWEQLLIVCGILLFQMILSPIWLKYFRYGPFEWLWRSLTYWNIQAIRQ